MAMLVEYEWVFQRGNEKLIVQRWCRPDRVWELTVIWPSGEAETEGYLDVAALGDILAQLERELIRSGWALLEFRPERRNRQLKADLRPQQPSADRRKLGRLAPHRRPQEARGDQTGVAQRRRTGTRRKSR